MELLDRIVLTRTLRGLTLACLSTSSAVASQGEAVQVSGPPVERVSARDVFDFKFSPDGAWILYTANQDDFPFRGLYATPARGRFQVRRLDGGGASQGGVNAFELALPLGRVVYRADPEEFGRHELFSAALRGGTPTRLHPPLASGGTISAFLLTPDRRTVVFEGRASGTARGALFLAPVDASGPAVPLGTETLGSVRDFALDPGGTRVVFRAGFGNPNLYVAPLDRSAPPLRLNADLGNFGSVGDANPDPAFLISHAGDFVLYRSDFEAFQQFALYRVPIGGGPSVRLSGTQLASEDAVAMRLSSDDRTVAFSLERFDRDPLVCVVPSDASAPVRPLVRSGGTGLDFLEFTAAGEALLARIQRPNLPHELLRLPIDGSPVVALSRVTGGGAVEACQLAPDRRTVVYSADESGIGRADLYRVAADGASPRRSLSVPGDAGDVESFALDASGRRAFYLRAGNGTRELFAVPLDLSSPRVRLDGPLVACGSDVSAFAASPDGAWALYRADALRATQDELFLARADGAVPAVRVQPPFQAPFLASFVGDYLPTPDGTRVVYTSNEADAQNQELFVAPIDGSAPPVRLAAASHPCGGVRQLSLVLAADGSRAFFFADLDTDEQVELYSVTLDGEKPPVKLSGPMIAAGDVYEFSGTNLALSPDGSRVAYVADAEADERFELYVASSDGQGPLRNPVSRDLFNLDDLPDFTFTPDGRALVAVADLATQARHELFLIPADASGPPVPLSGALVASEDVRTFQLVSGGRVVFVADKDTNEVLELYLAHLDGSQPVRKLSGPLVAGGDVARLFSTTVEQVVYQADANIDEQLELFSARLDGSTPPVRLNGTLPVGARVSFLPALTPDGTKVVYQADQEVAGRVELFVAPSDGSAPARKLSAPMPAQRDVQRSAVSDTHAVYQTLEGTTRALFAAPLDGSSTAVELTPPLAAGAALDGFYLEPDGRHVLYLAAQDTPGVTELYRVPVDGSGAPERLHAPFPFLGTGLASGITNFPPVRLSADGRHALFTGWLETGLRPLFSATLGSLAAPFSPRRR